MKNFNLNTNTSIINNTNTNTTMNNMNNNSNNMNNLLNELLPSYGQKPQGPRTPIWNEGQKLFIIDEYESAAGNRYCKGLRFCENIVIVETFGMYHTFQYINSIEVYIFEGTQRKLVDKRTYDKAFYNSEFIMEESKKMVRDYLKSKLRIQGHDMSESKIAEAANSVVDRSYRGPLDDEFCDVVRNMLPLFGDNNTFIS